MFRFELALTVKRGYLLHTVWALVVLLTLILWPNSSLFAAEPGTFMVRGGPILLKAKDASGDIKLNNVPLPGAYLTVDDVNHYGVFLSWALTRNISLETIVSMPLKLEVYAGGGALGGEFRAAQVDVMPLILIGRYTPEKDWYGFRPYAGLGAAYVWFDNKKTTAEFDSLGASMGLTNPVFNVDNQLRPVVELGLDYLIGENWFVNASWLYLEGDDEVSVTYSNGAELVSQVSYAPQIFALTLGYQF